MWPADPSGRKWTSDRFQEALKRESRIGLGLELTIPAYREIAYSGNCDHARANPFENLQRSLADVEGYTVMAGNIGEAEGST
ncbi:hypothetical protein EJ07DRAFT_186017 [Lizonia empirigonia]|nr:hypothetical protein EJ07DRAFT_186017 [Lizonia empirigonia]